MSGRGTTVPAQITPSWIEAVLSPALVAQVAPEPITRVLFRHVTDRWYFGDFLRHAPWLGWLAEAFPAALIEIATLPAYLPLYGDGRFASRWDATCLPADVDLRYPLVVTPGPYRPTMIDAAGPLLLSTWDTGWQLHRRGQPVAEGAKRQLNYFRAAHPATACGARRGVGVTPVVVADAEREAVDIALDRVMGPDAPVIIYNPTASNEFTRATSVRKEIDNRLSPSQHAGILRRLVRQFPDHRFLVGSALKPGDEVNERVVQWVAGLAGDPRVVDIQALAEPFVTTIRGFAVLLSSPRICSSIGAGTGTNTHLAQITGTWALSFERGADPAMRANWARPEEFQMGSFRWRNPGERTAIHVMDFSDLTEDALHRAAQAFACHHALAHPDGGAVNGLFTDPAGIPEAASRAVSAWPTDAARALVHARWVLDAMTDPARTHFGDFADESAYLHQLGASHPGDGLDAIAGALQGQGDVQRTAVALFEDSNLDKLLRLLAGRVW